MLILEKLETIYNDKAHVARLEKEKNAENVYVTAKNLVEIIPRELPLETWIPLLVSKLVNAFENQPDPKLRPHYKECVLIAESFIGID